MDDLGTVCAVGQILDHFMLSVRVQLQEVDEGGVAEVGTVGPDRAAAARPPRGRWAEQA